MIKIPVDTTKNSTTVKGSLILQELKINKHNYFCLRNKYKSFC